MIANKELSVDDYLAIGRRRFKVVLAPALIALAVGVAVSFAFTPKYTSNSLLMVQPQVVPAGYVKPIITEHVSERMITLQQNVLSRSRLQALVNRLGLVRGGKSEDDVIEAIRQNLRVIEANPNDPPPSALSGGVSPRRKIRPDSEEASGFYVNFTADNARDAQQVCAEITSMLLAENLELRQQTAQGTTDFLGLQLAQAKQNLDTIDQKLSEFKKSHMGQLPGDDEKNLKILGGLTSQLDATTQALSRAQQDKSFAESLLAQETDAWKSSQATPNVPSLRQRLIALQDELVDLESRYTEDHPDVVKVKKDIAQLKASLKKIGVDKKSDASIDGVQSKMDPPDILRLRENVHQSDIAIGRATKEQKRLQGQIETYQQRLSLSPEIEEQYKQLTRDVETSHTIYDNLLNDQNKAQMQTEMERKQQGERIKLLDPANLPDAPSFPVRWKFGLGGLAAGLCVGLCIAGWQEFQDKSIRDEGDVMAALELPMLAALPWLGESASKDNKVGVRDRLKIVLGRKKPA